MARKKIPTAELDSCEDELVPIKIRKSTYRLVKTAAAWLGISAVDYITKAVIESVPKDLQPMPHGMQDVLDRLQAIVDKARGSLDGEED